MNDPKMQALKDAAQAMINFVGPKDIRVYASDPVVRNLVAALAASPKVASDTAPGLERLVASAKHHIAYLRSFDKQPLAHSVELMEGLIAALSASPTDAPNDVNEEDGA